MPPAEFSTSRGGHKCVPLTVSAYAEPNCKYMLPSSSFFRNLYLATTAMPFIHDRATVIGNVELGHRVSIWPNAVLRADTDTISIGDETNIQDGTVIHVDPGVPCRIGARVTVGHRAVIHGATIEDECLVGMGAIVLNGAVIGRGSVIGAGAVVKEGMQVPPGSLVLGVPGKVVKPVDADTAARISRGVDAYLELQERHMRGEFPEVTRHSAG